MTYYRMAIHNRQTAVWIWKTTTLTSLQAVFQLLRSYRAFPQDGIRVFTAASKEDLNEMLRRENTNQVSCSATAAQFLQDRKLHVPGQCAAACGAAKTEIRQSTTVATHSPFLEHNITTGVAGVGDTNPLEKKRLEIECGPGGDHDTPYRFTLPISIPQLLSWTRIYDRGQAGELQP